MHKTFILLIAGALSSVALAETPARKAEALYQSGLAAEKAGNPSEARKAFAEAVRVNPHHANARYRLGQLKLNSGTIAAKGREAKLGSVVIPVMQLDQAPLQEALQALGILLEKESKGEVVPNFVINDPKGVLADAKISFQLKAVPAKAVLEYILTQANAKARYDEHAVVIVPN